MAKAQTSSSSTEAALLAFASKIMNQVESTFENMTVSSPQPISSFPPEGSNYLYVLNSNHGMPLRAGIVSGEAGTREVARLQKEAQSLAASGMVASYRFIEFGSARMAQTIGKWFSALYGGMTLSGLESNGAGGDEAETKAIGIAPVKKRAAGSGKKGKGRRGRPRKNVVAAETNEATTVAPKRRGRPPGTGKKAKGKRGRPKKSIEAAVENAGSTEAPKRRGRPPGTAKKASATKGKRGRPRKSETVASSVASAAPAKRRGRPAGSGKKGAAKRGGAKRGRKPMAQAPSEAAIG